MAAGKSATRSGALVEFLRRDPHCLLDFLILVILRLSWNLHHLGGADVRRKPHETGDQYVDLGGPRNGPPQNLPTKHVRQGSEKVLEKTTNSTLLTL